MSLTRRIARPMLASMFVMGGLDAVRHPESKKGKADAVAPALARTLGLPEDTVLLVRINGGVQIGAGLLLATNRLPRLAALALAASLAPTTYAGHPFWEETEPGPKAQQRVQFFKNVSMMGGLLLAAVDTDGRPSVAWRARKAAGRARAAVPIGD